MVKGIKSMGIINFINNFRYLFRYNLKRMYESTENIHYAIDYITFEIEENIKQIPNIIIKNNEETLEKLLNSNCSLTRFGDGEMCLTFGMSIPSQKASEKLSQRLQEVLKNADSENLMIGLSPIKNSTYGASQKMKKYTRELMGKLTPQFCNLLKEDTEYYSSWVSVPYITCKKHNSIEYFKNYFNKIRNLWEQKDIVIVCGKRVFDYFEHNIFDNAKNIEYIYAPTNNAFDDYDNILEKVYKLDKNKLIILILGATATVMAYDLCNNGYRALDLGHLSKDYNAFLKQVETSDNNILNFFSAE